MEWKNLNRDLMKTAAMACMIALPLTACDDDDDPIAPPAPDRGSVELAVADDAGFTNGEPPADFVEGTFEGDLQLQLFTNGTWQNVGAPRTGTSFELGSTQEVLGSTTIDAGTYDQARVVITNGTVEVLAGTQIGEGEPIEEDVTVQIAEGDEVVAHYDLPVIVQEDGTVRLLLNLNSHLWMNQQALDAEGVSATEFENSIQLTSQ